MMPDDLPETLPIFPLPGVILLPHVHLPLNMFEPRYLAMTDAALKTDRLIGMIQPGLHEGHDTVLCDTGCAGRIVSFEETEDNRYLITLKGVSRFSVQEELPLHDSGFRMIRPGWADFAGDLKEETPADLCRDTVLQTLRRFLEKKNMVCDKWQDMQTIPCGRLVSTLSVVCPFPADEKQLLLEAKTLQDRMRILQCLMEHDMKDEDGQPNCH